MFVAPVLVTSISDVKLPDKSSVTLVKIPRAPLNLSNCWVVVKSVSVGPKVKVSVQTEPTHVKALAGSVKAVKVARIGKLPVNERQTGDAMISDARCDRPKWDHTNFSSLLRL